jgi:hypothetical protein
VSAQGFESLYRRRFDSVQRFLLSRLPDRDGALEATNETFLAAFEARDMLATAAPQDIDRWLRKQALQQAVKWARDRGASSPVGNDFLESLPHEGGQLDLGEESGFDYVRALLGIDPESLGVTVAELLAASTEIGVDLGPVDPQVLDVLRRADPREMGQLLVGYLRSSSDIELDLPLGELFAPLSGVTLLGPDGQPASDGYEQEVAVSAQQVTTELMARLARDPRLLYELHPRQFEEVIADLFAQQGYEVTLTAASNDGGADLYVLDRRGVGSFLYLVECKRYRADRPVGVGVVRQLFGVVQAFNATAGIVATTSHFTSGAQAFATKFRYQLSLHDFVALKKWLSGSDI